jgi:multidrug efflux pump subunit AcrB
MEDLYQDLDEAMPRLNHAAYEGVGSTIVIYILLAALKTWLVYQLRKRTCENSDEILSVVQLWIQDHISLPRVSERLQAMAERTIEVICRKGGVL